MLGDVLRRRLNELKKTHKGRGPNPFFRKIQEIAIEELFEIYPSKVTSEIFIQVYYEILSSNEMFIPRDMKEVCPSNNQKSYQVSVRNIFSSNRNPSQYKNAVANRPEIISALISNRSGDGVLYQANPSFSGKYGNKFRTISTYEDGTSVMSCSSSGDKLVELIDDFIDTYNIEQASPLSDDELEEEDNKPLDFFKRIGTSKRIRTNPRVAKTVLEKAKFNCALQFKVHHSSLTFRCHPDGHYYLEAHHLIPLKFQNERGPKLDISANIVALCPNCHRAIHYGTRLEKITRLQHLYDERKEELSKKGIDMKDNIDQFIDYYYM